MNKLRLIWRCFKDFLKKRKNFETLLIAKIFFFNVLGILFSGKYFEKKYELEKKYLKEKYKIVLDMSDNCESSVSYVIWFFWWQGYDCMPEICKACYRSLEKNRGRAQVIFIDQNNFRTYVDVPKEILVKVEKGIFSRTHLSDVIRTMLLSIHGGLWVDATLFFVKPIPEKWFYDDFFSLKNRCDGFEYISKNLWSTFIMGAKKGSPFFNDLSRLMQDYAIRENDFIEYMTIDVFMAVLFEKKEYRAILERIPIQNEDLHLLRNLLNEPFDCRRYECLKQNNVCFKLTYKMELHSVVNGKKTFYERILNEREN